MLIPGKLLKDRAMRTIALLASQIDDSCHGWRPDTANSFARFFIKSLAVVVIGIAANSARADSWTSNFTITGIFVAGQNNYQYRVNGMPAAAECAGYPWGYVNDSDAGSAGMVAAFYTAYASAKQLSLHVVTVNGFCHIIEMFVSG
jgi:hypothetical protein